MLHTSVVSAEILSASGTSEDLDVLTNYEEWAKKFYYMRPYIVISSDDTTFPLSQELIIALVKDAWHLRSPCQLYEWERLAERLKHVLALIYAEIRTLDQQATIYAAHALDCLVPLDKSAQQTRDSWWKQKSQGHRGYRFVFQLTRLQKIGVIEHTYAQKYNNSLELVLEPLYEVVSESGHDDQLSSSESNMPVVSGLTRRFIPGMFELRIETPDTTLHRTTVSLVDLLCRQHQGMTSWSVSESINLVLEPFIQLILDTYYTTN
ncbi:unnamed protein product [Dicrocoelium dendriticum]|nr:unnamed protein product [Dicrocoelium dendriticum]